MRKLINLLKKGSPSKLKPCIKKSAMTELSRNDSDSTRTYTQHKVKNKKKKKNKRGGGFVKLL